jgi:hypothetical protein
MSLSAEGPAPEFGSRHAACASVALDIGGGRGALVIYPSERFRDREIEISSVDSFEERRVHTGVHERPTPSGTVLTAVFGSLEAGDYVVWIDDRTEGPVATVSGASVTELTLA